MALSLLSMSKSYYFRQWLSHPHIYRLPWDVPRRLLITNRYATAVSKQKENLIFFLNLLMHFQCRRHIGGNTSQGPDSELLLQPNVRHFFPVLCRSLVLIRGNLIFCLNPAGDKHPHERAWTHVGRGLFLFLFRLHTQFSLALSPLTTG